jgi:hypothetical protein
VICIVTVAYRGGNRNAYLIVTGRTEGGIPPGIHRHKWGDYFNMCLREVFVRVWTGFIGNQRIWRQAVVMNLHYAISVDRLLQAVFHSWQEQ